MQWWLLLMMMQVAGAGVWDRHQGQCAHCVCHLGHLVLPQAKAGSPERLDATSADSAPALPCPVLLPPRQVLPVLLVMHLTLLLPCVPAPTRMGTRSAAVVPRVPLRTPHLTSWRATWSTWGTVLQVGWVGTLNCDE